MSNTNLTKEEIIAAWRDPKVRERFNTLPEHPSGKSYGELTEEELAQVQGAAGVNPVTTPHCIFVPLTASIILC